MLYAKKNKDSHVTELSTKKEFVDYVLNALQQRDTRYIYDDSLLVVHIHDGVYDVTPYLDQDWHTYLVISDILYSQRGWI
jgi:hypothetical protein